MKKLFNINESEIKRILSLHKNAISKQNNKIQEGEYPEKLMWSTDFDQPLTPIKGTKKGFILPDFTHLNFVKDKDGAWFKYGDKTGWFSCKTGHVSFAKGARIYKFNDTFTKTLQNYCRNDLKIKEVSKQKTPSDQNNEPTKKGYAYTYIPGEEIDQNGYKFKTKGGNLYFRCEPYKDSKHFRFEKMYYQNDALTTKFKEVFCKSNKPSYTQQNGQIFLGKDTEGKENKWKIPANTIWKWKSAESKSENEIPDFENNSEYDGTKNLPRYQFDYEAVLKAIKDTGKCKTDKVEDGLLDPDGTKEGDCKTKCKAKPLQPGQSGPQVQGWFFSADKVCYQATGTGGFSSKEECEACNCATLLVKNTDDKKQEAKPPSDDQYYRWIGN